MTREEIQDILPHRGRMLLLDRLETGQGEVRASYRFRADEWFFDGHFPGYPIVPGAIVCEMMAQACCGLFTDQMNGKLPLVFQIRRVLFRRPFFPGDVAQMTARYLGRQGPFDRAQCQAGGSTAVHAEAEFVFCLKPWPEGEKTP